MLCGNGSAATLHPSELFGDDWMSWGLTAQAEQVAVQPPADPVPDPEKP